MIKDERLKQKLISAFLVLVSSLSLIISDVISILKGKEEERKKKLILKPLEHMCVFMYTNAQTLMHSNPHTNNRLVDLQAVRTGSGGKVQ